MHELIIVGAGPAGLAAALYAGRYRINTLVFEKMFPGGQIILSPWIDNYPAFPGGVSTEELIARIKKQVEDVGVKIEQSQVVELGQLSEDKKAIYSVRTPEKEYQAKSLILALGATAKRLGIPGEERLIGKGVSYCATCDGPLFKEKDVVVVGGGDKALEEALVLTAYAKSVTIVHRRQGFRAAGILQEKVKINPKIKLLLDVVPEEIIGQVKVDSLRIKTTLTNSNSILQCAGVFIFVGIKPNTDFLEGFVETDKEGFIVAGKDQATSKNGIFACGDCLKKEFYQVINACAEGAQAVYSAYKYLINL
ncbi:MAG: thioredoxin-disulfide reductase [Candidatus Omnitrophota bacterium]|nr:thioredoxin-disulfide reductase [Candidatus Omnitrophota bacterium]